jgi:hypothetical protein
MKLYVANKQKQELQIFFCQPAFIYLNVPRKIIKTSVRIALIYVEAWIQMSCHF